MTGLDLIAAATAGLTGLITKTIVDTGGKLLGRYDFDLNQLRHQLQGASREYAQRYNNRHGSLKVLGMREPVALESIYTAVRFLQNQDILNFVSPEALEKSFRQDGRIRFRSQKCEKLWGIDVANSTKRLMVLGEPGAGKSTFLRRMGLEALKGKQGKYRHECLPIFLELKSFDAGTLDIEQEIIKEFRYCGYPYPEESTQRLLKEGKLLVLLDGLDEVPSDRLNTTITQIQNVVDQYDKNRFIASCRTAAYRHNFHRFTDVAMADFDDEQIEHFINNWFQSEEDKAIGTAQNCWEILQKRENEAAKELAHTPLLLTFLCLTYDRSQTFPENRSVLYRKALRILLEEWAAEKRILRDAIYQGLNTELEEVLLSEIAHDGFEQDQLFFPQRELVGQIKRFLASNLNAPTHLDGEAVLSAIAIQQGILVERAEDIYSFSHLTLQEYLTAQYIVDNQQIQPLVANYLIDERWREVFLLVAGLMPGRKGADDLLLLTEQQTQTYINTPKLRTLLKWSDAATADSDGDYKPAAKQVAAIFLALDRALDRALDLAREFAKLKIFKSVDFSALIAQLEALKSEVPTDDQPVEVRRAFVDRLLQLWFNALDLDPDVAKLSEDEITALNNYFYANELMVRCKEAAMRVSPQIWAEIDERMLTVRE
ncbi:NACHT domain-containing protein [Oculatella sp. LEGE 06141]|uniref:NACHT domain-containing protein n=1 Tax=Oculatella sp. LEGE 06141 TaxID=1828648 RepID=UPI00187EA7A8|nr:NACHT domain-containing protein [Oculatella sp. LEGE 06141]MBE9181209.1 NACHT domain-containing protein [Oculatella sp. LEGE 06141]